LRTCFHDELKFYFCEIQSPQHDVITIFDWETEAKQQIKELLQSKNVERESDRRLSQQTEEFIEEAMNGGGREGRLYTFQPNWKRSEVYPAKDSNGESLIEEMMDILDGICREENTTCKMYQEEIARINETSGASNTNTSQLRKQLQETFTKFKHQCYKDGYKKHGTTNQDGLGGGGNLPLDAISAFKIAVGIFNSIPKQLRKEKYWILWIGTSVPFEQLSFLFYIYLTYNIFTSYRLRIW